MFLKVLKKLLRWVIEDWWPAAALVFRGDFTNVLWEFSKKYSTQFRHCMDSQELNSSC